MYKTSAEIKVCAEELIAHLSDLQDARGSAWTDENFRRLEAFTKQKHSGLQSFYRAKGVKTEFLWDFIAVSPETGIFLAAESEQAMNTEGQVTGLKHDFEKLLYVYSPIRLLITKAWDPAHAHWLAGELTTYAETCCRTFNPGAVFILHFGLWNGAGNVSYLWQSNGEPRGPISETLAFKQMPTAAA